MFKNKCDSFIFDFLPSSTLSFQRVATYLPVTYSLATPCTICAWELHFLGHLSLFILFLLPCAGWGCTHMHFLASCALLAVFPGDLYLQTLSIFLLPGHTDPLAPSIVFPCFPFSFSYFPFSPRNTQPLHSCMWDHPPHTGYVPWFHSVCYLLLQKIFIYG